MGGTHPGGRGFNRACVVGVVMNLPINTDLLEKLQKMSNEDLLRYADRYNGLDGRELVMELVSRLRGERDDLT